MAAALVFTMVAHIILTAFLYVVLTIARAPSVWGIGLRKDGSNPWAELEPRISANLSNQFEWPVFFHVVCLALLLVGPGYQAILLAWVFVIGRILHSAVQILTSNVRLRGIVFMVNFLAVLGLWALFLMAAVRDPMV